MRGSWWDLLLNYYKISNSNASGIKIDLIVRSFLFLIMKTYWRILVRRSTISLLLRDDVYIGWCCEYLNLCDNNIWDISSSLSDVWSPALVSSSGWLRTDLMTRNHSWGVLELVVGWHGCDVRLDTITFVIPLLSPPTCNNGLGAVQPADITRIFERIFSDLSESNFLNKIYTRLIEPYSVSFFFMFRILAPLFCIE